MLPGVAPGEISMSSYAATRSMARRTANGILLAGLAVLLVATQMAVSPEGVEAGFRRVKYGPGIGADSLNNTHVGGPRNQAVAYRFRATTTARLRSINVYIVNGKSGYSGGNGGRLRVSIRPDDRSARHRPASRVLAQRSIGRPPYRAGVKISFASPPLLRKGRLYHVVLTNDDPNPTRNYFSMDGLFVFEDRAVWQPAFANRDWAQLVRGSGRSWTADLGPGEGTITPIMSLEYANGHRNGLGYMEVWSPTPRVISGERKVREVFRLSGRSRSVRSVTVRLKRATGSGALRLRLKDGGGRTVAAGSVPAPRIAQSSPTVLRGSSWVTLRFRRPIRLVRGRSYQLVLSSDAATRYSIHVIREGASYEYDRGSYFGDGHAEYHDGSRWHLFSAWGRPSREGDLQFFFR
jgi:hypothetical protein